MGTCTHFAEHDFLCNTSAKQADNFVEKLWFRLEVAVFFRKHHCVSASLAARHDCHFMNHFSFIKH
ncbi:Uncharacterised protein [Mycobacterium tuberculosis]|nr:Uncharacterised protein [Mycobacterium tuberculosis]